MPLMRHQETGAEFLAMRGFAILADEMGSGKSVTVVRAADIRYAKNILLICPAVVRNHWLNTFQDWQVVDRPIYPIEGVVKQTPPKGVVIVSHASLADKKSVDYIKNAGPFDLVILDEAHLFRKLDAQRTTALMADPGVYQWGTCFWCVTGTPIVNSACDIWPLAYGPMRMGLPWWDFGIRYCEEMRSDNYGMIRPIGMKNTQELANLLRPHVLRRTLAGVGVVLPPLNTMHIPLRTSPDILRRVMADLEGWTPDRMAQALQDNDELHDAAIARVRKALGLAKVDDVALHVHQMLQNKEGPVVVFFQHTAVRERLYELLNGAGHVVTWIDGKVTPGQSKGAVEWFQAGKIDVALVQTEAGGVGITLHRANRAVTAELPWTAVGLHQSHARIHRIGQTRACLAEIMRANGCWLEESLANAVSRKHRAADELMKLLETTE